MAIKIGHASIDENGKAAGGTAGDQTGREVCIRSYYKNTWDAVMRPKKPEIAEKSAKFVEDACANRNIGYDQWGRNSLFTEAKKVNFDCSKITVKCECDCSSLIHVAVLATGANVRYVGNAFTTRTMIDELMASGDYEKLTDCKYIKSDEYLKRGDILVKKGGHTVMVLEDGSEVSQPASKEDNKTSINVGDVVSIKSGATYYNGTKKVPAWVLKKQWIVKSVSGDRIVIDKSKDGQNSINSSIDAKNLIVIKTVSTSGKIKVGSVVSIKPGATYYNSAKKVPEWVLKKQWIVKSIKGSRIVIDKSTDNKSSICSAVDICNIIQ